MEEYKKVTISFTKDQLEKLDEIMSKEQGYTRSSLVREAVDNYIGYRVQKESVSYLSPIISQNHLFYLRQAYAHDRCGVGRNQARLHCS